MIDQALIIIRSVGERTEHACYDLLKQLFPAGNIEIVRQRPFSESIRKSFKIAIDRGLPWALCVDADVLVDVKQLPELLRKATEMDENIFQVQGLIFDKFIPVWRPAGGRVYRTSLIEKAIHHIPEEGTSLRPESDMLNSMSKLGYPWMQCDVKVGIHDYEQYYEDIYRKCFLQAHKHTYLIPILESYWHAEQTNDVDFHVALMALRSGKVYGGNVYVDKEFLIDETVEVLKIKGIKEKKTFNYNHCVQESIEKSRNCSFTQNHQQQIFPEKLWNRIVSIQENSVPDRGMQKLVKKVIFKTGDIFEKTGYYLKRVAKS